MKIKKLRVKNFRLLEDIEVALDDVATIIVGRNNSGKTSLTEVFFKFLSKPKSQFSFEDFSLSNHGAFLTAFSQYKEYLAAKDAGDEEIIKERENEYKTLIPVIQADLLIEYEKDDSLASLSKFILDLDQDRNDAQITCRYCVKQPERLMEAIQNEQLDPTKASIVEFIRANYRKFYGLEFYAVDSDKPENREEVTQDDIKAVLLTRFISAQSHLDDDATDKAMRLSKAFEEYYTHLDNEHPELAEIKTALLNFSAELEKSLGKVYSNVYEDIKSFGEQSAMTVRNLGIKTGFTTGELIKGNTQLFYGQDAELLPESHHGLGYSRLIFMIMRLIIFYAEFIKELPTPDIQLIFVEEPEAHMHPQMQIVFIKQITNFVKKKIGWNVQIVVTTHSSHIVAESGFECLRYFDISESRLAVRDLSEYVNQENQEDPETIKFLQQYMTLNRCDMFFADKIILIEGTVERLLLPKMIKAKVPDLLTQYISIVEVGGAYAHLFSNIVKFINVKTLVITDIDSVDATSRESCKVESGSLTSNQCLIKWMPKKEAIDDLLSAGDADKVEGKIRVAYEIKDVDTLPCGRSFEEAFIIKNSDFILRNKGAFKSLKVQWEDYPDTDSIITNSYKIAGKISKKPDFAFDIMLTEGWDTPKYIAEGLEWLK